MMHFNHGVGGAKPLLMQKNTQGMFANIKRSTILISIAFIGISLIIGALVLTPNYHAILLSSVQAQTHSELEDLDKSHLSRDAQYKADKIDSFYASMNLPLEGYGADMVASADAHGIDWNLLAAIGFIESTGGKFACTTATYNTFGWGSCKINFESYEVSINHISAHLGGKRETTKHYYNGKTLEEIIDTYNPPSIRKDYKKLILETMERIENQDIK
ncbi:MAG: hypothetical protein ACI9AR_000521 [Flavobacteriaceae bacterium]|jgi:hypothetical protein